KVPPPRIIIRDPAAERRAEDRRDVDTHPVNGHRDAAARGRKTFEQDWLSDRLKRAAAHSLQNAGNEKYRQVRRGSAQGRCERKNDNADDEKALAADVLRDPARCRENDRI